MEARPLDVLRKLCVLIPKGLTNARQAGYSGDGKRCIGTFTYLPLLGFYETKKNGCIYVSDMVSPIIRMAASLVQLRIIEHSGWQFLPFTLQWKMPAATIVSVSF